MSREKCHPACTNQWCSDQDHSSWFAISRSPDEQKLRIQVESMGFSLKSSRYISGGGVERAVFGIKTQEGEPVLLCSDMRSRIRNGDIP